MKGFRRIVGAATLATVIAVSGFGAQKVYAAEQDQDTVVVDADTATDVAVDDAVIADTDAVTDDAVIADTDAVTDDAVTDDTVAADTDIATDDTAIADTSAATAIDVGTDDTAVTGADDVQTYAADEEDLKDASMYTTWSAEDCADSEELENAIDITCEDGESIETIFKLNLTGANTVYRAYWHNDDLTDYCQNLPSGLKLYKYVGNSHAAYIRVRLAGTVTTGKYNVTITVPKEKLMPMEGYEIPENGVSVTIYLTVNGKKIPVEIPIETPVEPVQTETSHEHHYEWTTVKAATATEDGIEALICSCGAVQTTRTISAYGQWLKSVEKQILTAEQNATVEVKTDVWNTYNKAVMDALKQRSDVTLVTTFGKGENAVTFEIPAGASTTIVEEATALAASVKEATAGEIVTAVEEPQWYGVAFLTGAYANK